MDQFFRIFLLGLTGYCMGTTGLLILSYLAGREFNLIPLALLTLVPYCSIALRNWIPSDPEPDKPWGDL